MTKSNTILIALFCLLAGGVYYVTKIKKDKSSSEVPWDMDFAVQDPNQIHKIFIADRSGKTATVERTEKGWMYNGKFPARPTAVKTILETLSQVVVNYVPPKAAEPNMIKSIAAEGLTVEIFGKNGQKLKRYYVGGVTNDERGTFMIMEGSENPYVVHVPSFIGQLRVRYILETDDWRDRAVFAEKPDEITYISVDYPKDKFNAFKLEKTGEAKFVVSPLHTSTPVNRNQQRTGSAESFLLQFESLAAEAFENNNPGKDSIRLHEPFAVITVKKADGTEKIVRFIPREIDHRTDNGEAYVNRFFADCNWGDFMLTQIRVFQPVFRGYNFFFEEKLPN